MKNSIVVLVCLFLIETSVQIAVAEKTHYEGYYQYLDNYPSYRENDISEECQGVTHDNDHWFFSTRWKIYKIPVTSDLNANNMDVAISAHIDDLPGDHNHIGDLDYRAYEGRGYVFAPLEGGTAAIGVFDAANLAFLCQDGVHSSQEGHSSWVAVHPLSPDGGRTVFLYTSKWENVSSLIRYTVDLNLIHQLNTHSGVWLDFLVKETHDLPLYNEDGVTPADLDGVQGGAFSPSGELIYISSNLNGLSVFDSQSGRLVNKSSVSNQPFKYEYHPGNGEEPEGLTIWDLEDGRAPNINGFLHVVMLDNDVLSKDNLYFKHYTRRIFVDAASTDEYFGKPKSPYATVGEAVQLAKDGQEIVIKGGLYNERLSIDKKVLITGQEGTVVIGVQ